MKDIDKFLVRRFKKLKYPFLNDLSSVDDSARGPLISQINEIAKGAYSKEQSEQKKTLNFQGLVDLVNKDPSSWLICEDKKRNLLGYAHVQLIDVKQAEQLIKGKIDENELIPSLQTEHSKKCIHIGSVVSKHFPLPISNETTYRLLAGTLDKIIELREANPSVEYVVCCDYEDYSGDRHFRDILPRYGFVQVGTSANGDTVYKVDLESKDRPYSNLVSETSNKRGRHLSEKSKEKTSEKLFNSLLAALKKVNAVTEEAKGIKSNLSDLTAEDESE